MMHKHFTNIDIHTEINIKYLFILFLLNNLLIQSYYYYYLLILKLPIALYSKNYK